MKCLYNVLELREYKGTKNFDDFFGAVASIKTDEVKGWTSDLVVQRQKYFADLTQSITK